MQVASKQHLPSVRILLQAESLQFYELLTGPRVCRLTCDSVYAVIYLYTQSLKRSVKINTTHSSLEYWFKYSLCVSCAKKY